MSAQAVAALLRQLDFHGEELRLIDAELGRVGLAARRGRAADDDPRRRRDRRAVDRRRGRRLRAASRTPHKLVSYLGLNPRVRQSGGQPAAARADHQARAARTPAGCSSRPPGRRPRRRARCGRSIERVRARRGMQIAVVATARKLAVLCWHLIIKGEDYAFARPSLTAKKLPRARAARRAAVAPRPEGQGRRLLAQGGPPARERARRARPSRPTASWSPTGRPRHRGQARTGVAAANGARLSRPSDGASCAAGLSPRLLRFAPGSTTPTAKPNATSPRSAR